MSSTGEHDLREVSAPPRLSCFFWEKNRNYKVIYLGGSDRPVSCKHVYSCCTRNTTVVQLSQDFYYGLSAGRPKSKNNSIGLFVLLLLDLLSADAQFGINTGVILGFLCKVGGALQVKALSLWHQLFTAVSTLPQGK